MGCQSEQTLRPLLAMGGIKMGHAGTTAVERAGSNQEEPVAPFLETQIWNASLAEAGSP